MAWQAGKDLFVKEGERTYNPLILLVGAQGFEPWTR
jgi:hypothetical protein